MGFGDHIFNKEAVVRGYHTYAYCTEWTPMLGEAVWQVVLVISRIKFVRGWNFYHFLAWNRNIYF